MNVPLGGGVISDTTPPTIASVSLKNKTSNSITVVANGYDKESGISHYQFSKDDGKTWTKVQESNEYTFSNLSTGTYKIKSRVINGSYDNKLTNKNYKDSDTNEIETGEITVPIYTIDKVGWQTSKTVTITYPEGEGLTKQYSLDGGNNWQTYTNPVTFTENGTILARVTDGTNTVTGYINGSSYVVSGIDTTGPTSIGISSVTNNATNIIINYTGGNDSDSDIKERKCYYGTSSENLISSVNANESSCTISTSVGTKYYYKICITNNSDLSTCSNESNVTTWVGIPAGTYKTGQEIIYGDQSWYVVKDNGATTTLISKNNISTGTYSTSTSTINDYINNNSTFKLDSSLSVLTNAELPTRTTMPSNNSNTPFWTRSSGGNGYYILGSDGSTNGYAYTKYATSNTNYYNGYSSSTLSATSLATNISSSTEYISSADSTSNSIVLTNSKYTSNTTDTYYGTSTDSKTITSPGTQSFDSATFSINSSNRTISCNRTFTVGSTSSGDISYCNSSSGSTTFNFKVSDTHNYTSSSITATVSSFYDSSQDTTYTATSNISWYMNYFNSNCSATTFTDDKKNAANYYKRAYDVCVNSYHASFTTNLEAIGQCCGNSHSSSYGSGTCYPTQPTSSNYQFNFGTKTGSNYDVIHTVTKNTETRYFATGVCSKKTVYSLSNDSIPIGIRPMITIKER